ncbi:hypothetical protein CcCBS67573_g09336, partial [Chytriomyces confervae]
MGKRKSDDDNDSRASKSKSADESNPYLAHLNVQKLPKMTPRKTTAEDAEKYEAAPTNLFNGRPFSQKYRDIM